MVDKLSIERRSENMRRIKSKDTKPEMKVRKLLFQAGYRYRLHDPDLPAKPDIVFRKRKKIILVHGCFWHGHIDCRDGRIPKSRTEYWLEKIRKNKSRDDNVTKMLELSGWNILVVWECEIENEPTLMDKVNLFLKH